MGSVAGRRCSSPAAAAAAAATAICTMAVAALPAPAAASGSERVMHTTAPKLAQLRHVAFWECPAPTTELLVSVDTLTLQPGATLRISFTVHNGSATACTYTAPDAGPAPGPTATPLDAGPCGSMGFAILGPHDENEWPGPQVVNCPALGSAQLAPNGTVSGTGTWNQTKPNSSQRVPVGNYTLVVDGNRHVSFQLSVVAH